MNEKIEYRIALIVFLGCSLGLLCISNLTLAESPAYSYSFLAAGIIGLIIAIFGLKYGGPK